MEPIGNFNSVFEVAFAINALFYIFEFSPFAEDMIEKALKLYYRRREEKFNITQNHYAFPVGYVLSNTYPYKKKILEVAGIIASVFSLAVLIYAGFEPEAQIATWAIVCALVLVFMTPGGALILYWQCISMIKAAHGELDEEITRINGQPNDNTSPKISNQARGSD